MKPGILTTEFWFLFIVTGLFALALFLGKLPGEYATIGMTALPVVWALLRQIAKKTPETADDAIIEAVESFLPGLLQKVSEKGNPLAAPEPPKEGKPPLVIVPKPNEEEPR